MIGDGRKADWYPHPQKRGRLLYWDGLKWTEHEAPDPNWATKSPRQKREEQQSKIVCQFCQETGCVTVGYERRAKRKTATRMLFGAATLGGSLAATGVSKKGTVTVLHCTNCGMKWDV